MIAKTTRLAGQTVQRRKLARRALHRSLKVRRQSGHRTEEGLNVYDLAEDQGIEVRFLDVSSMEGMYSRKPGPLIIISSERPVGRQRFTCAHELGHHVFGHGSTVDQLKAKAFAGGFDSDEFLADAFAGFLLMPKIAIQHAFVRRDWSPDSLTATQAYVLACSFGVGYSTFLHHSSRVAQVVPTKLAGKLSNASPKKIRLTLLGHTVPKHLVVVDQHWSGRPIDVRVGDLVLALGNAEAKGHRIQLADHTMHGPLFEATSPGISRIKFKGEEGWASFVRASRMGYVGRSKYRHLEE